LPVEPTQHLHVEREQARAFLQIVLDGIDADKRAVFVLYEMEELEMNEIAEALGVPIQTAYSRLHAARKVVASSFARRDRRTG